MRTFPRIPPRDDCYDFNPETHSPSGSDLGSRSAGARKRTVENHGRYYFTYELHRNLSRLYRNDKTRRPLLRALGSESYAVQYSDSIWALREAVGKSWQLFVDRQSDDGDVHGFVRSKATKAEWDRFFLKATTNTKWRRQALAAVKTLARDLVDG